MPHHVTQRGNRRSQVFYSDADHRTYLAWLHDDSRRHSLEVLAYCLMPNHVHLVVIPALQDSMEKAFRHLHTRYAQRLNRLNDWKGHVWQGRYFSSALDERHFWVAMRYVELNPVRAGLVGRAEEFPWSSARAHCGGSWDQLLSRDSGWDCRIAAVGNWSAWLATGLQPAEIDLIRRRTARGLPCGSEEFVHMMECMAGRPLKCRQPGRPPRGL